MDVVERIFALMSEGEISAAELSKITGIKPSTFTQWKKGQQKPSTDAVVKIAEYFGVTTDYLLTGKEMLKQNNNRAEHVKMNLEETLITQAQDGLREYFNERYVNYDNENNPIIDDDAIKRIWSEGIVSKRRLDVFIALSYIPLVAFTDIAPGGPYTFQDFPTYDEFNDMMMFSPCENHNAKTLLVLLQVFKVFYSSNNQLPLCVNEHSFTSLNERVIQSETHRDFNNAKMTG
ncbi:MAG: helix-turn-helix transcriptional regulator [Defluviitaleaceae bacterium]|nr:helix-turn-helix transcriptional regulator [Defluviitaleaceae bacterium]